VSEFAKLDPVALLKETQRAAAPEHMVQWHDELKELRRDEKKVQSEQQNEGAHLKGLQDKQNATRADVVRWNERQALVSKSQLLEKSRPIIVAKIRMKEIKEKKASMRAKQRELLQYEAEVEPAQRAQREMEAYRDQVEPIAKSRKIRLENGKSAVNTFSSKIDSQQQTMIGIANEIDGEKKADRDRKLDRKRIESEIVRLQRAIDDKPVELDAAAHETQQSDIRSKRSNLSSRKNDAKGTINSIRPDVMNMQEKLRKNVAERQTLDTQLGQRDKALSRLSPHTSEAWTWLEKNKASLGLREDVHAPPLISCSVSDPHLAKIVETQIRGHSILAAITCTNPHDSKIVQDKLVGRKDAGGLGLHSVTIRTSPKPLNWYKPPVTDSELRALGFDSWIIDYIQGPDPVLAMLCDSAQIHRAAHASKPLTDQQFEAMQKSGISRGVSGNEAFAISTRAEYNASSTRFNKVNEARHFTDQPVDADEKNRLDQAISELEQNIANCKVLHNEAAAEIKAIEAEEAQVEKQKVGAIFSPTVLKHANLS
jgi:chromosome segregation ATPase